MSMIFCQFTTLNFYFHLLFYRIFICFKQFARIVWSSSIFIAFHFCMYFQLSFYICYSFSYIFPHFGFYALLKTTEKIACLARFLCAPNFAWHFHFHFTSRCHRRRQSRYSTITVKSDADFFRFHSLFIRVTVIFPDICLLHLSHSIVFPKQERKKKINPKKTEKVLS